MVKYRELLITPRERQTNNGCRKNPITLLEQPDLSVVLAFPTQFGILFYRLRLSCWTPSPCGVPREQHDPDPPDMREVPGTP